MASTSFSRSEAEQSYLKLLAYGQLAFAVMYASDPWYEYLNKLITNNYLKAALIAMAIGLFMYCIFNLYQTCIVGDQISKKAFWSGKFEDEYARYLYSQATLYAMSAAITCLILSSIIFRIPAGKIFLTQLSIDEFVRIILLSMALAYSWPIFALSRNDDEWRTR